MIVFIQLQVVALKLWKERLPVIDLPAFAAEKSSSESISVADIKESCLE